MSDVVVLLPGITGITDSILRRDGLDVCAPWLQAALGTLRTRGSSIERLPFHLVLHLTSTTV